MALPAALPASRVPDSAETPPLRWAILGPGWIADKFVRSLATHTRQQVVAVGSRSLDRAQAFAAQHDIPAAYGNHDDLVSATDVDIVYVATQHPDHVTHALVSLDAGKHVLVEKPIAITGAEARSIAERAACTGLFCAEAMWSLYLPKWDVVRQLVESGALGRLTSVLVDYGERFPHGHRVFDPALAGGPLLDLGPYPLSMALSLLGPPERVVALGQPDPSGVIGQLGAVLTHAGGGLSVIATTAYGKTRNELKIVGTDATLTLEPEFNLPGRMSLTSADGAHTLTYDEEPGDQVAGLHFQAAETARRIAAGQTQTPVRTLASSILTLDVSDEIQRQL